MRVLAVLCLSVIVVGCAAPLRRPSPPTAVAPRPQQLSAEARALFLLDDYAEQGGDQRAEQAALEQVHTWMADRSVTVAAIKALPLDQMRGHRSGGYAFYKLAETLAATGEGNAALEMLQSYVTTYPKHELFGIATLRLAELGGRTGVGQLKIGVILPLSGEQEPYGSSVLHGMECAIGVFDPCRGPTDAQLIVRDSHDDPGVTRAAVEDLAHEGVVAIVGPLSSQVAEAAARRAEELHVPLISLAQRDGIAELGDSIFRNTITPAAEVAALVHYSQKQKSWKHFYVLYPENPLGEEYNRLFTAGVAGNGGDVIGRQAYAPHQMDFANQLHGRESGKQMGNLVAARAGSFDAIFIPDSPAVVGYLVPVLAMMGIEGVPILGPARWNSAELLERGGQYVEGAIFVSAFSPTATDEETKNFVEHFRAAYNGEPTLLEALGYDAVRMVVASAAADAAADRSMVRDHLARTINFPGVTGRITMDGQGDAIHQLTVLTVKDGSIIPAE